MAVTTLSPGVYIEEVNKLPASIAPVGTAIPAFVGHTEKAVINGEDWDFGDGIAPAVRITSFLEFQEIFGGPDYVNFDVSVDDTYNSTGDELLSREITANFNGGAPPKFILYYSVFHFFSNGGSTCYIVAVDDYAGFVSTSKIKDGINSLEQYDEPTLVLFPDSTNETFSDYVSTFDVALQHCAKMQDRFVIGDLYGNDVSSSEVDDFRSNLTVNNLKYGAIYTPYLNTLIRYGISNSESLVTYNFTGGGTGDPYFAPPNNTALLEKLAGETASPGYPSLYEEIIAYIDSNFKLTLPPSPAMAGIYAKVDRERGVWKAPANVSISQISGPTISITTTEQDYLNVDPTAGKSINAIRTFNGRGTLVWGARTLDGNSNEWRYVNVRRLFLFVEESIEKATQFVVFEPNTASTWQRVRGMIEAFLTSLWRDGALAGATTEDAFYVRVGLGTTMTAQDILEGKMIVEVGIAASRPAEFIVLQFSHKIQES